MAAQEKLYFALMILSANATLNFTVNAVVLQKERVKKLKMNRLLYKTRRNNSQSSNLSNIMYIKMTQLEEINVKLSVLLIRRRQAGESMLTTILSLKGTLPLSSGKHFAFCFSWIGF